MTMTTFQPKNPEAGAEWLILFNVFKDKQVGDLVTYEELDEALDRDFRAYRGPIYACNDKLLAECKMGLEAVTNVGYRIVSPFEHEKAAKRHHARSKRQMNRAVGWIQGQDRSGMSIDEQGRLERIEHQLLDQQSNIKRLTGRVARQEEMTQALSSKQSSSDSKVAKLVDVLKRKGLLVDEDVA